jgi:hypothetical protein
LWQGETVADDGLLEPEPTLAGPELLGRSSATAVVVAALLGLSVISFSGSGPATRADGISSAQAAKLAETFRHGGGALLPVDLSSEQRRDELMQALRMSKMKAESLMAMVDRGERMLGWLVLWDNYDEDGDVASVTAAGFTQSIPLMHAPTRILVPYVPGQPVFITGERDGIGGGVTVAVELSTGPLPLPPLAVGQTIALPIQ